MPFTSVSVPAVGDPTARDTINTMIANEAYLNSQLSGITTGTKILNGSFEADTDADGIPDNWTRTLFTGGSTTHDNTDRAAALKSFKFTSPGGASNGGGHLTSSDYFEVSPQRPLVFRWQMKSSVADVKNIVRVFWYKSDLSASATASTDLYSEATANPTAWAPIEAATWPPSDAYYAKLRLIGCDDTDATAGSTWFDDVSVEVGPLRRAEFTDSSIYHQWICPAGITSARVTCIGGGGGGGGRQGTDHGGGGGGAGEVAISVVAVTPGTVYPLTVGVKGDNVTGTGNTTGTTGGNSSFNTTTVVAVGGTGGNTSGAGGAGGTGGTGQIKLAGQTGGTSTNPDRNGGTGGACQLGGGGGGGGTSAIEAGLPGQYPGGGGGGGYGKSGTNTEGSDGGGGMVIVEW